MTDGASACSKTGRNYFEGFLTNVYVTGCVANVWAVTLGEGDTGIQLPSGQWKWQGANFATPHENIGNC